MRMHYTAQGYVADVIAGMGRTEDIRFSPDNTKLAITCFDKNQVVILDLHITAAGTVTLTDAAEISSSYLKCPHGVDFIGNERIIVANREGGLAIFELPLAGAGKCYEINPSAVLAASDFMYSPGAVSVTKSGQETYDVLICNNYGDKVTRHTLNCKNGLCFQECEFVLSKWLAWPDAVSVNGSWIAISNHGNRNVLLYNNVGSQAPPADPDGILRCIRRPHGVRFTSDGRYLLVADYETPYVHIYLRGDESWRGVRTPTKSLKVISNEDFLRGSGGPLREGGVKGIDVDNSSTSLVVTSQFQPLVFFDFAAILEEIVSQRDSVREDQIALELEYELISSRYDFNVLKREIAQMKKSRSWKITAPLRWVNFYLAQMLPLRRH